MVENHINLLKYFESNFLADAHMNLQDVWRFWLLSVFNVMSLPQLWGTVWMTMFPLMAGLPAWSICFQMHTEVTNMNSANAQSLGGWRSLRLSWKESESWAGFVGWTPTFILSFVINILIWMKHPQLNFSREVNSRKSGNKISAPSNSFCINSKVFESFPKLTLFFCGFTLLISQ